ncbi:MAG: tRNA (adenosine(37)-N6)-threonylcarbamoyltransferase complex dimerization subunit type 1 TsaB [Ahniella sp.]|nr:tRNA (adenosine(37)-N6)-threonylcarbamoyltransferase complex dimerization subunit type 1 TsaB [Ahniella sp.]
MNLLAIDTATEACSAAIFCKGEWLERFELAPRRHAQELLPMIDSLLAEAGIGKRAIDAIAVGRGPGAFTGVRLAISTAQGMALALDRPVLPISSLAALAQEALPRVPAGTPILAAIDARMGEVYAGVYRSDGMGLARLFGDEAVGPAANVPLPFMAGSPYAIVGTGWAAFREPIELRLGAPILADATRYPRALAVLQLALPRYQQGLGLDPDQLVPSYLRDKIALTEAERSAQR